MSNQVHTIARQVMALLCLLVTPVLAQQPFQYRYTTDNARLPSLEVTGVGFAKDGATWVEYSSGEYLSRFDGVNWTHYHLPSHRLPVRLHFFGSNGQGDWFSSDFDQEVWVACFSKNGGWEKPIKAPGLAVWMDEKTGRPMAMDIGFATYGYDPEKKDFIPSTPPVFKPIDPTERNAGGIITARNGVSYLVVKKAPGEKRYIRWGDGFRHIMGLDDPDFQAASISGNEVRGIIEKDGEIYWFAGNRYIPLKATLPNGREGHILQRVTLSYWGQKVSRYSCQGLVVEDPATNTRYLFDVDTLGQSHLLLGHIESNYFGFFTQDATGNWWYGTTGGLLRTDQSLLVFEESNPEMVSGLHAIGEDDRGRIWMGGYNGQGGFTVFDWSKLKRRNTGKGALAVLPGSFRSPSGTLYFFAQVKHGLYAVRDGQLINLKIPAPGEHAFMGFYFQTLSNGKIGLGLSGIGLGIATEKDGLIDSVYFVGKEKGLLLINVLTITEDQAGRLWMGRTSQGLAMYDPHRDTAFTWLRSPEMPNSLGAISSCLDEEGTLWLGANNGIYQLPKAHLFDAEKGSIFQYLRKFPLPGRDTSAVVFLKNLDNYMVAGTALAVYFIDKKYKGNRPRIFTLQYGSDIPGSGSEQNAVLPDSKGGLWIGTQEGAVRLDLQNLHFDTSATDTEIRLDLFMAGGEILPVGDHEIGKLPLSKRNIELKFSASGSPYPYLKGDLLFDVAVVKSNGDTFQYFTDSWERQYDFIYLPPDSYSLHITAYKHNVVAAHATYQFVVPRTFNEKPLFWIILVSFVLAIPFAWFYQKKHYEAKMEKSKREQDGLKVRALANFFHPHFINNTLNWMQTKYRKDEDTAKLIGGLRNNVKILYDNTQSGKVFHSLDKELLVVKNYLFIQEKRFGGVITYQIPPEDEWKAWEDVRVPALLLQIHVENAIEKGIRKDDEGEGHMTLEVEPAEDGFIITIEDNGRGRPLEYIRDGSPKGGSTSVMEDLVTLMNAYNSTAPITVKYEDLIFDSPVKGRHGTRVVVFIPKNYRYEFSQTQGTGRRR